MAKNTKPNDDFSALDDLIASVDHEFQDVEVLGKEIRLRPVTILECVRLVKRFPVFLKLFESKLGEDGKPLPAEQQGDNFFEVVAEAGSPAISAWVACAANRERDVEFELAFSTKPDKLTIPLFGRSCDVTFGKEGALSFFVRVWVELVNLGVIPKSLASKAA